MRIILQQFAGLCCRWRHIAAVKPGKILFIETAGLTRVVSVPPFFLSKFGNHRAWRGRVGADIGDWCGDEGNLAGIHRQVWGIRNVVGETDGAGGRLTLVATAHAGRTESKGFCQESWGDDFYIVKQRHNFWMNDLALSLHNCQLVLFAIITEPQLQYKSEQSTGIES